MVSLRDYDAKRHGPFLGISDDGSSAQAIRDAALGSPKALALSDPDPLAIGVAHDAERLGSVGEVPVGPEQYQQIRAVADGRLLMTTNVGSHVNIWHYRQPPARNVSVHAKHDEVAAWAREHGAGFRNRNPQPWLRLRFAADATRDARIGMLRAAAAEAPVCLAVRADDGLTKVREAIEIAATAGAQAVAVDGTACAPTEGRPALPGLLNYFDVTHARELLRMARDHNIGIEPALKIDTDSIANQIWTGLYAAQEMGLHLGKYGLFPLTFQEIAEVVGHIQRWTCNWTAAPVFYVDVPWIDGHLVYEPADAPQATDRWLELVASQGAQVVLIDTVDKARGRHLVRTDSNDTKGIFSWDDIRALWQTAVDKDLRVLWAGGIHLTQVREFGRLGVFGVYVTTAAVGVRPLDGYEHRDIGLTATKEPMREKIALIKLLLETGFLADAALNVEAAAAERGDGDAAERLATALLKAWQQRLGP